MVERRFKLLIDDVNVDLLESLLRGVLRGQFKSHDCGFSSFLLSGQRFVDLEEVVTVARLGTTQLLAGTVLTLGGGAHLSSGYRVEVLSHFASRSLRRFTHLS